MWIQAPVWIVDRTELRPGIPFGFRLPQMASWAVQAIQMYSWAVQADQPDPQAVHPSSVPCGGEGVVVSAHVSLSLPLKQ